MESQSESLHSQSSTSSISSLSSQPSLPSVPSLTTPSSFNNYQFDQQPSAAICRSHCLATLSRRSSHILSLALSGKFLYSGWSNSEIRAWSHDSCSGLEAPANDSMVAMSDGPVKSLVVLGERIFSGHQDHKIRVWKIDQSQENTLPKFYNCIATLPTLNDRFLKSLSPKNYVQVRRHKKSTWVHHVDTVSALAISNDGSLLFSASWDRSFKVWRTLDYKCLESVSNAHDDAINAIEISNDGVVYTGSADKKIKAWKRLAGEKKHRLVDTLEAHKSAVNALAISSDGLVLYSGACDRSILVWEKNKDTGGERMEVTGALRGHTKAILCLSVTSDLVCSGSADNTVRIWRRGVGKRYYCLGVLEGHRRPVKCLTVAVDSNVPDTGTSNYMIYSGGLDGDIKVWRISIPIL